MTTTNTLAVTYLDHMGTDWTVVNAARASFNRYSEGLTLGDKEIGLLRFLARGYMQSEWDALISLLSDTSDRKLIEQLIWQVKTKATHFVPFSHPQISLRIEAPLAIARQVWRSTIGVIGGDAGYPGWSEESRRYVDRSPEFFEPEVWRGRAENIKQGSSDEVIHLNTTLYKQLMELSAECYDFMIKQGIAPEQARFSLLNSATTSWTWTGSLAFFARLCWLRKEGHAQLESNQIAQSVEEIIEPLFPHSWAALHNK